MNRAPVTRGWDWWLVVALTGTIVCSLMPLVAPAFSQRVLSLLVFAGRDGAPVFSDAALRYMTFVNGVLGAVMVGWAVALLLIVTGPFARREPWAWHAVLASLLAWFVPGTLFSLWSGAVLNVVVNILFIGVFGIPLLASYRFFRAARG